jgi:stress-induced-phosphoprotein 1
LNRVRGEPVSTDQLRILGNKAYRENRMEDAIRYYSEAITASPKEAIDHRLLSNRSLLYLTKKDYANALVDAEKCIEINPCFWKGYYRTFDLLYKLHFQVFLIDQYSLVHPVHFRFEEHLHMK